MINLSQRLTNSDQIRGSVYNIALLEGFPSHVVPACDVRLHALVLGL